MSAEIVVGRVTEQCRTLGPGIRYVVWVAGCARRCRECIAPDLLSRDAGTPIAVATLAEQVLAVESVDGITLSGGEPFEQAAALVVLIDMLREQLPQLSAMAFSGRTLGWLRQRGTLAQRLLIERLDILVDGPYVPERHISARWRGSSNQCVHFLTDRHRETQAADDVSAGLQIDIDADGAFSFAGVPPTRGFRPDFEHRLRAEGIHVSGVSR
jgi:anaerobic ribonucleoside-triphosphate reductase activating protein